MAAKKAKGGPLTDAEKARLTEILGQWEADEYDNAGDFPSDTAEFHDRDLGSLKKRFDEASEDAAQIMIDVYGDE